MDGAATGSPVLLSGVTEVSAVAVSSVGATASPVEEMSFEISVSSVEAAASAVTEVLSEVSSAGVTGSTEGILGAGMAVSVMDEVVSPGSTGDAVKEEGYTELFVTVSVEVVSVLLPEVVPVVSEDNIFFNFSNATSKSKVDFVILLDAKKLPSISFAASRSSPVRPKMPEVSEEEVLVEVSLVEKVPFI